MMWQIFWTIDGLSRILSQMYLNMGRSAPKTEKDHYVDPSRNHLLDHSVL